jgi:hypothetical protein
MGERMDTRDDYYEATLENGELMMTPHCRCGNRLNEDYYCEKCRRHCRCFRIVCDTEATLALVQKYIRTAPQFSAYAAGLDIFLD